MRIIKPDAVSLLPRTLRMAGQHYWAATTLLGFDLTPPAALWDEARLWEAVAAALGEDQILDAALPKPAAEALLVGACYPAGGKPVAAGKVRLAVGSVDKTVYVFGDRTWTHGLTGLTPSAPADFTRMPLDWAYAFGGQDFARNPLGRGACAVKTLEGHSVHPLPNIEDPNHLIASPADRPEPAGFGSLPMTWPQRGQRVGAFDDAWLKNLWPLFPADVDFRFFNTAPEDQWLRSWPQGDETFTLEGALPSGHSLQSVLPGYRMRVFVTRGRGGGEDFSEIPLHIDTLWFFPDHNLGVIAFRGAFHVDDDEASELDYCYIALELLNKPKFLPFHYQDFMHCIAPPAAESQASDEPAAEPEPAPESPAPAEAPHPEEDEASRAAAENLRKAEFLLVAELAKLGIALEPESGQPSQDAGAPPATDESKMEDPEMTADAQLKEAEARLDQILAEAGLEPSDAPQEMPDDDVLAQSFDPLVVIAALKAAGLLTPELEQDVRTLDKELNKSKALVAELQSQAAQTPPPPEDEGATEHRFSRTAFQQAWTAGRRDFSGQDLSHADLSDLDLSGAALGQAVLRAANLANAVLDGADLREADLTGATLTGCRAVSADFSRATLLDAELRHAVFAKARCDEADFSRVAAQGADFNAASLAGAVLLAGDFSAATFVEANLEAAICTDAHFSDATFVRAVLQRADFRRAVLTRATLEKTRARACDLSEAELSNTIWREAELEAASLDGACVAAADFSRATLTSASFFAAKGAHALFREARAANLRADAATTLPNADFSNAHLELAYFGGADLSHAVFDEAQLDNATFQKCLLAHASLHRARARGGRFLGCDLSDARFHAADLLHGSLAKSQCRRTDFRGANLFGVDTLHTVFRETVIEHANLGRTRIEEAS